MPNETSDLRHDYLSGMPDLDFQLLFKGTILELEKAIAKGERATSRSKKLLDLYCKLRAEQARRPIARDFK